LHHKTYPNTAIHAAKPPEQVVNKQEKSEKMAESGKNGPVGLQSWRATIKILINYQLSIINYQLINYQFINH
jgi:hypothetical protein